MQALCVCVASSLSVKYRDPTRGGETTLQTMRRGWNKQGLSTKTDSLKENILPLSGPEMTGLNKHKIERWSRKCPLVYFSESSW